MHMVSPGPDEPPRTTAEKIRTFLSSMGGPWARYVENPNSRGIGTVHYHRLVPLTDDETARNWNVLPRESRCPAQHTVRDERPVRGTARRASPRAGTRNHNILWSSDNRPLHFVVERCLTRVIAHVH